jgi:hypothetical protein
MNQSEIFKPIAEQYHADVYLYSATIDDTTADKFIGLLRDRKLKRENCVLINNKWWLSRCGVSSC